MAELLDSLTDAGLGECTDCPGLVLSQEHTQHTQLPAESRQAAKLLWQSG